jgi:hypothetical protein
LTELKEKVVFDCCGFEHRHGSKLDKLSDICSPTG